MNVEVTQQSFVVAVHGGAGSWQRAKMDSEKEVTVKRGILDALRDAYIVLKSGKSHLDGVEQSVISLENNPVFNAGKGGKVNQNYEVELDASIMDGSNLQCGAICASKEIKNPVRAARHIMENTEHILLAGKNVDEYAKKNTLETVPNDYFFTEDRINEYEEAKAGLIKMNKIGTVGAVAFVNGNLAASTSTGGTTFKMAGRVGDSPIIGAGNYANNDSLAISCTGTGEVMIRNVLAYDVHARMHYKGVSLKTATDEVLDKLPRDTFGFVAVDKYGNVEMPFNTGGMARGYVREDGKAYVAIFGEDEDETPCHYDIEDYLN